MHTFLTQKLIRLRDMKDASLFLEHRQCRRSDIATPLSGSLIGAKTDSFLRRRITPILHFIRESDFWSTILLWLLIAGICVAVANMVAA